MHDLNEKGKECHSLVLHDDVGAELKAETECMMELWNRSHVVT